MSYSMSVELSATPELASIVRSLGADVVIHEEVPAGGWPEDVEAVHLYQVGKSTRGIEVGYEDGTFSVRMLACAGPDDWRLAYATMAAAAGPDATITGEDGTTGRCATGWEDFGRVMARELATSIVTIKTMVAQGNAMEMNGAVRPVYFGPKMLERVGDNPLHLLEAIQVVQYIDAQGFEFVDYQNLASLLGLGVDVGGFSVWDPTKAQAFAPAPTLGIKCDEAGLYISTDSIAAVAGKRLIWLDEKQFAIAATPAAELPALIARAKEHRVDFHAGVRSMVRGDRKWWQFWKR